MTDSHAKDAQRLAGRVCDLLAVIDVYPEETLKRAASLIEEDQSTDKLLIARFLRRRRSAATDTGKIRYIAGDN